MKNHMGLDLDNKREQASTCLGFLDTSIRDAGLVVIEARIESGREKIKRESNSKRERERKGEKEKEERLNETRWGGQQLGQQLELRLWRLTGASPASEGP
eukprot:6190924-Pleurochrysis_carterae.AAC.2